MKKKNCFSAVFGGIAGDTDWVAYGQLCDRWGYDATGA